jgi:predicted phage terminase large subunit-like protein
MGIPVRLVRPEGDKLVRSTASSSAWNTGRIRVPIGRPWVPQFVDEVTSFTGVGDDHDDDVDALINAFHALESMPSATPMKVGGQRTTAGLRNFFP